ncbi:anti-sigma factor [Dactylosporangium sp. AC04546]|uniref:anti-sigma factor n=1 Tax=Dactylosporangium sp. AC04546 TaxID=2862460 RepID=UPI002E7BE2C6|nr:anti-sigma factor [Dactylosporangium sp. AC04546]WVK84052.1 anti-sigma factor [Dactylosporangium sp. AC04546]
MPETVDIHALAGAYALDAVDDIERAAFDRHLRGCSSCAAEVVELRETAAWLTHPVAEAPPARLRDNVLAQIAVTPQARPGTAPSSRSRATVGFVRRWAVATVAAAVVAAAVGTGTWVLSQQRLSDMRVQNAQVDAVLAAADARLITKDVAGGRVTMVLSPSRDAAVAVLEDMRRPGDGKAYQLWMINSSGARPVGLSALGKGRFYIDKLEPQFGITVEPEGGSKTPTLPLVERLDLPL